jgi:large subunit ribosomal protein L22
MAEKKDTEQQKKPARKPASRKKSAAANAAGSTASSGGGSRARKPAAKPKKETATRGKGAAEATSKTADEGASRTSTARKPAARKAPAKKPAARKAPAESKAETQPKAETKAKPKPRAKKEAPERLVVNARARFVRVAPRKARLVADQVRGLPIDDARALLRFSTRSAAQDIRKLIDSAAANAEANHDLVADDLLIKDIHVDEGPTLRRYRPRALGRATRINKRTSHIAVALTPEE